MSELGRQCDIFDYRLSPSFSVSLSRTGLNKPEISHKRVSCSFDRLGSMCYYVKYVDNCANSTSSYPSMKRHLLGSYVSYAGTVKATVLNGSDNFRGLQFENFHEIQACQSRSLKSSAMP